MISSAEWFSSTGQISIAFCKTNAEAMYLSLPVTQQESFTTGAFLSEFLYMRIGLYKPRETKILVVLCERKEKLGISSNEHMANSDRGTAQLYGHKAQRRLYPALAWLHRDPVGKHQLRYKKCKQSSEPLWN